MTVLEIIAAIYLAIGAMWYVYAVVIKGSIKKDIAFMRKNPKHALPAVLFAVVFLVLLWPMSMPSMMRVFRNNEHLEVRLKRED